ncbi:BadF/BadG/BcrA/BcrD ATPase family protein [Elstera litoralis]|uniref:BadF/BadG/BcrA/BcrD ATPase family protein n=1 Tax=Elstera litoralis TaxID=552518 RepID=UPI000698DFDD|nr:BadF/BadG/BcrA/BcrD ATPase family protein [Elstera litoralis]
MILSQARGPASGLSQGVGQAWEVIQQTLAVALEPLGQVPETLHDAQVVLGLAGVNLPAQRHLFEALNPLPMPVWTCPNSYTTLVGALGLAPGVSIAVGTGSVAAARLSTGDWIEVGGWGFPSGDEGSRAWLGLLLTNLTQRALDGRRPLEPLTRLCLSLWGGNREAFFATLGTATQAKFAEFAPMIVEMADAGDALALVLMREAAAEIGALIMAADPSATLPVAFSGGLAPAIGGFLAPEIVPRVVRPLGTAAQGAVFLARQPEPPPPPVSISP